ncbi:MAG: serine protease [Deltaproteobacteria bacterium RIFOXYD12_FULL_57_12]|nr:MAG: serine protease [Deltaproteobacteria bacterium RIFOXYD12_FULL_57_12]
MNILTLAILLQLAGLAVVIAEIILPSGGILALLAMGLFGYAIFLAFQELSTTLGMIFIIADLITIPILVVFGLKMLARSPVTLRSSLSRDKGVTSQASDMVTYVGKTGRASSNLRPGGVAVIDGRRLDVVSRGEFITKDAEIVVMDVTGNQIIVREKES